MPRRRVMSGFQRRRTVLKPLSGSPGVNAKFTPGDLAPMAEEPLGLPRSVESLGCRTVG